MIFTERTITIKNGESKIDESIVVYRGDYELEVRFTILNSRLGYLNGENLITSENAEYGQLAILTPYGGNIFSDVSKCSNGTVSFTLTKSMLDQIEEVGAYSFQIRLFDYNKNSRVTIPPIEYGIKVREPIASEDHDNEINNAIVGYSIAKVINTTEEKVGNAFDNNGEYNKTNWKTGDRISQGKLNKIEDAIFTINHDGKEKMDLLERVSTTNFNILDSIKADRDYVDSKVFSMENMGQDIKTAMTGGSVAVVGENSILSDNIVDKQIISTKLADNSVDGRSISNYAFKWGTATAHSVFSYYGEEDPKINLHYAITIKNTIGNIRSGSKIRLMCSIKNYAKEPISIYGMGLGCTDYNNGQDYTDLNKPSLTNYQNTYVYVNDKDAGIITGYTEMNTYDYEITSDTKYLVVSVVFPSNVARNYNFDVFNLHINVNGTEYYGDDIEILYADIHRKDRHPLSSTLNEIGNPINVVNDLSYNNMLDNTFKNKIVNKAMFYGIDDYVYVKMKSTSDSVKWALMSIPNLINGYDAGDVIKIKVSIIDLGGFTKASVYAGIAPGLSSNGVELDLDYIPKFNSGSSINRGIKDVITEHVIEITMENSSIDELYDRNPDRLILGLIEPINAIGRECEFMAFDISISKNNGEFIPLDINDVVYCSAFSDDGGVTEDSMVICSKGLNKVFEPDANKKLVSIDNISAIDKDKRTNGVYDISIDINEDGQNPWFIGIIDKNNLNFEDGLFRFKWKITSDDLTIHSFNGWCIGYVSGLDDKVLRSKLPGLTNIYDLSVSYDGTYLYGCVPSQTILDVKPDGYDNLCIGVRVAKMVDGSSVSGTNLKVHCENVGTFNPFSYIDIFKGYPYTDSRVEVSYPDKELIMTNKNVSELMMSDNVGKYLSVLGDSISTFTKYVPAENSVFYDGKKYGITDASKTWWGITMDELGMQLCVNNSWSGSRVTTTNGTAGAGCMDRCQNLHTSTHEPDIIIVYMGINDFNNEVPLGTYDGKSSIPSETTTFREAYGIMLDKILTRYQNARVFVSTLPYCDRNEEDNGFPEINAEGVPLPDYNNAIRELADSFGLDVIELSKCGITYQNRKLYLGDELHPNEEGMKLVARKVINTIRNS